MAARNGANHLDRVLLAGSPRDYLQDPFSFGQGAGHLWKLPSWGTGIALRAAIRQHVLVCSWRRDRTPATSAIRAEYGISKQTWSRIVLGQRWAGQAGLEVLLEAWLAHASHSDPR